MTDMTEGTLQLREDLQTARAILGRMSDELPCPHTEKELVEIREAAIQAMRGDRAAAGKLPYEAPEVTNLGSFEEVTQAGHGNGRTDAAFGAGTPIDAITAS
jgi:hypothetical protein